MNCWPFKQPSKGKGSTKEDSHLLSLEISWSEQLGTKGFLLLAKLGSSAIGKAHGKYENGHSFYLTKIDVFDPHKGKGHGTIMIFSLIGAAKTKKCTKFVFEGVSDTNSDAIRLYTKHGAAAVYPKLCKDKTDYEIQI